MEHLYKLTKTLVAIAMLAQPIYAKDVPVSDIKRFTTVLEHVKNYYVNTTDDNELFENAIRGLLEGLDPHSTYYNPVEFAELKESTSGIFGGLGIEVSLEDGFIKVVTPIDDTPAAKAGVKAGDLIVRLDDAPVKGMPLKEAIDRMRGKPGTSIYLVIIREGESKPLKIKVTRAIIDVQSVKNKLFTDNIGYIRISQFQSDTGDELKKNINQLLQKDKNLNGVVLDLRNNPGGVLEASVQVADAFLDKDKLKHDGLIVYTKGRLTSSQLKEVSSGSDMLSGMPIVVMVNEGSASAAEIVAGALQDHRRALIVGSNTFGKGSVQTILPLNDKHGLKLTTAFYYTPAGRSIQATGIKPDIKIADLRFDSNAVSESDKQLSIKEADLQGHLANQTSSVIMKKHDKVKSSVPDIYSDYQLHEAINILKGLIISRN